MKEIILPIIKSVTEENFKEAQAFARELYDLIDNVPIITTDHDNPNHDISKDMID